MSIGLRIDPLIKTKDDQPMSFLSIADQAPAVLAYLDPGSGSLLLQMLIAGALSGMFFMRTWFGAVRTSMSRVFKHHA